MDYNDYSTLDWDTPDAILAAADEQAREDYVIAFNEVFNSEGE